MLQAQRQPGSGFKPFVYSSALSRGITPADIFLDAPLVFDDANLESQYRPENDNSRYNGPTRLRQALYRSDQSRFHARAAKNRRGQCPERRKKIWL